jgi:hypothetical protein
MMSKNLGKILYIILQNTLNDKIGVVSGDEKPLKSEIHNFIIKRAVRSFPEIWNSNEKRLILITI